MGELTPLDLIAILFHSFQFSFPFFDLRSPIQVSVQWEASPNTADASDYTPMGARVTFPPEVSSATIPLFILDDVEPEFAENFTVRLLDVSIIGGARLGDIDAATINILPSDDPNGALGN